MISPLSISLLIPCRDQDIELLGSVKRWMHFPAVTETILCCPEGSELISDLDPDIKTVFSNKIGRGCQQNTAAAAATGNILLFHHLDSELTERHTASLAAAMQDPDLKGGAYYRHFDERHPGMKIFENVERWHCRKWGALYGDQSIFVRREIFQELGGFPDYPLMEDVAFSKKLRNTGGLRLLDPPMRSSPRRHLKNGPWRTTAQNATLLALYYLGVSPRKLHRWYYPENDP